jgi:hypothetical protein
MDARAYNELITAWEGIEQTASGGSIYRPLRFDGRSDSHGLG